jgi:uncharacterized protein (DUF433 family)
MSDPELLSRITVNIRIFGGKPIIRNLRISVELVLSLLKQGASWGDLLEDYPGLETDDIRACLAYAQAAVGEHACDLVEVVP